MQSAVQQSKGKRGADSGSDKQQEIGDKGLCEPVCSHLAQQNTRVNPLHTASTNAANVTFQKPTGGGKSEPANITTLASTKNPTASSH